MCNHNNYNFNYYDVIVEENTGHLYRNSYFVTENEGGLKNNTSYMTESVDKDSQKKGVNKAKHITNKRKQKTIAKKREHGRK